MKKTLSSIAFITTAAFLGLTFSSCGGNETSVDPGVNPVAEQVPSPEPTPEDTPTPEPSPEPAELNFPENHYSFGDYVVLGNFVVNFIDDIEFLTITDAASELHGAEVIRVPMTIENISHTNQNPNTLNYFLAGPDEQPLKDISGYFEDENMIGVGSMTMASQRLTNMHFLYQGSGLYYVWFEWLVDLDFPVVLPIIR